MWTTSKITKNQHVQLTININGSQWLNSAGPGRNSVPQPVSGVPPPEIAVPPPKVVAPLTGDAVPSP